MDKRSSTGQKGEAIAKTYLESKGWRVRHTNWRSRIGELDIVGEIPGNTDLIIVEVRTRTSRRFGTAVESVDHRKQQRVRRLGLQYAQAYRLLDRPLRFDVITVFLSPHVSKPEITHLRAVF